ncbi:hypothetical protein [Methanobrevibacter arboriphilus]|uniref:hypothetical protein n=1 Tax=Methanobrevibacter arboriphilus TaxID=39441 RepID=UPI001CDABD48|nr:hypothetical protein [Methanobrevibacter arboriphilus]
MVREVLIKKRAADVNKVKKLSVKIQGKKNIIIKRPGKTWSKYGYYPQYPAKQLTLKGSIKGKKIYCNCLWK